MMTRNVPVPHLLAIFEPCEQYRYRVDFPDLTDERARDELFRSALLEVTATFLECTAKFQSVAWIGPANLSFADSMSSPSDRKSKFLHMLVSLRVIERRLSDLRAAGTEAFRIETGVHLPRDFRRKLEKLCKRYDIGLSACEADTVEEAPSHQGAPNQEVFAVQPLDAIAAFYVGAKRRLSGRERLLPLLKQVTDALSFLAWIYQYALRGAFTFYYKAAAERVLKRMDGERNVFLYFEIRSGTNREVEPYLRWKYGSGFVSDHTERSSVIPFTHLSGTNAAFSLQAMIWARRALLNMERNPADGCVVVNFLLTPAMMWKLRSRRAEKRDKVLRRLGKFRQRDLISRIIYREFGVMLDGTNAFAMEMAKCYQQFFATLSPGVVIQADALSKGARQLTTCARRRGGRVIYLADRICTALRTSNQLVRDGGDNPHIPDRCVVFDEITRREMLRQGFAEKDIHHYQRDFGTVSGDAATGGGGSEIRVLLQDYMDHLAVLISTGVALARAFGDLTVVFQEHPDFPVDGSVKSRLLEEFPGRILFPKRGERTGHHGVLAMLTGYSTAAVPGVLAGVPLIWLRRQVDNSIYGEPYLERIGFAADTTSEVISRVRKLRENDPETTAGCSRHVEAAREIFRVSTGDPDPSPATVLDRAVADSLAEINR
ncbi:MAG: hypothetical protein EOP88_18120 [Verrucomicrobiaceae bacterium]|nr:MAG: hypothetical protein EOP88_18120 [Verrucomicrobiaceae bacterium]